IRDPEPERMGMKDGDVECPQHRPTDLHDLARALIPHRPAQRPDARPRATPEQRHEGPAHAGPRVQLVAQGLRECSQVGGGLEGADDGGGGGRGEDGRLEAEAGMEGGPGVEVVDAVEFPGDG
ncbi:hypothetical protein MMC29_005558, partial [Sticta canariensis]|nr:hypothetical protein [Sticta canariensis]